MSQESKNQTLVVKAARKDRKSKDKVYLKEEITKEETIIFMEDKLLYERDINEGMKVVIDGDGRLQKVEDRS